MDKYSIQDKNLLFSKIQQYVKNQKLTLQNMVDLHDILTSDKPTYSHNQTGTMYISSKYSDETFEKIEELLKWVDKQCFTTGILDESYITDSYRDSMVDEILDDTSNANTSQYELEFGINKKFKNTFRAGRVRIVKPPDVTKSNEKFKRLIKVTKKRSVIPIDHQDKQNTSWDGSFDHKKHYVFSEHHIGDEGDEDENQDENEGDEENQSVYEDDEDEEEGAEGGEGAELYGDEDEEEEGDDEEIEEVSEEIEEDAIEEDAGSE